MKRILLSAVLSCACLPSAFAQEAEENAPTPPMPSSVWMEDYTSPELAWTVFHGAQIAILPVGGTEQNGPHMTLRKHNAIITVTADQIARALGNTLVAPLVPVAPQRPLGSSDSNMAFAGTLTITPDHFEAMIEDEVRSLQGHGFRLICLMAEHSGAIEPLKHVAAKLSREWARHNTRVMYVSGYHDVQDKQQAVYLAAHGVPKEKQGTHAGVADTSESWAAYAPSIRKEKLVDYSGKAFSELGATGDDTLASQKLGEKLLTIKIASASAQIASAWKHLVARDAQRMAAQAQLPTETNPPLEKE